jgi:hypothetical protein
MGMTPSEFWDSTIYEVSLFVAGRVADQRERQRLVAWQTAMLYNTQVTRAGDRVTVEQLMGDRGDCVDLMQCRSVEEMDRIARGLRGE